MPPLQPRHCCRHVAAFPCATVPLVPTCSRRCLRRHRAASAPSQVALGRLEPTVLPMRRCRRPRLASAPSRPRHRRLAAGQRRLGFGSALHLSHRRAVASHHAGSASAFSPSLPLHRRSMHGSSLTLARAAACMRRAARHLADAVRVGEWHDRTGDD